MAILLNDDNFQVTQLVWSLNLQKPEIKNFTLASEMKVNILKLKNPLFTIVLKPYHQIQAGFVIFISKNRIFAILSFNLPNPKIEKLDLCPWEKQIQPLFGDMALKQI